MKTHNSIPADFEEKARLLAISSDPVRLQIFCYFYEHEEACVSDIAMALDMPVANISHHLQIMKEGGLCDNVRDGQRICYRLSIHPFNRYLKKYLCVG